MSKVHKQMSKNPPHLQTVVRAIMNANHTIWAEIYGYGNLKFQFVPHFSLFVLQNEQSPIRNHFLAIPLLPQPQFSARSLVFKAITNSLKRLRRHNKLVNSAFVPLCLCAFVPLCLSAFVPLYLYTFAPLLN